MTFKFYCFKLILVLFLFVSCKDKQIKQVTTMEQGERLQLKYATGFSVITYKTHRILEIKNPWPNSNKSYSYILPFTQTDEFLFKFPKDQIIDYPPETAVVTSTTHISSLELLGLEKRLVGFPGLDYISSDKTRELIKNGEIRELGKNEGINTEVLLELQPNIVIGFGVDGTNKSFETIKKAGIPIIYNGDWVESSPLAKAEWIKFFGILFNKEKEGDSIFNEIESNYLQAKTIASKVNNKPTVLSGAMHKDVWYLPNGTSPEAQILKDANVDYLWSNTSGKGSLALSLETVYEKAKQADLWLNPSNYGSLKALEQANQHYTKFDAFKDKNVYSFSNTTGKTGGVLYYELGIARPDLVLKDVIKVCHPNLLPEYKPHFFKKLE
ncbi:MAG: ABC transporter substrate-binding protein [Bacteroidia bacterium]|nr:ABC transporter substrate-binding protein [Bacteroidia bacterium]